MSEHTETLRQKIFPTLPNWTFHRSSIVHISLPEFTCRADFMLHLRVSGWNILIDRPDDLKSLRFVFDTAINLTTDSSKLVPSLILRLLKKQFRIRKTKKLPMKFEIFYTLSVFLNKQLYGNFEIGMISWHYIPKNSYTLKTPKTLYVKYL